MTEQQHVSERLEYLFRMPAAIPEGRVLVHNNARPTRRLGSHGFRAWWSGPGHPRLQPCDCAWAPELGRHYMLRPVADTDV